MSGPNIGALRLAVEVQTKPAVVDAEFDAHGEEVETWTTVRTMYASIRPATGREKVVGEQLSNDVSHVVTTRWVEGYAPKTTRLKFGSRIFNVVAVVNDDEASRFVHYYCLERV